MNLVINLLVGVQMVAALSMIGLILIQHGQAADMGAAFGSGSANFLSRTTGVLAVVFFACTLLLAYFSHSRPAGGGSLLERAAIGTPAPAPAPAASGPASQIPSGNAPAAPASGAPASTAPAGPASGAAQIPTK